MKIKAAIIIIIISIAIGLIGGFVLLRVVSPSRENTSIVSSSAANDSVCLTGQGGCSGQPQKNTAVVSLTPDELALMLKQKDFFFVNVHVPYEGEIQNTDVFIPYNEIASNLDKLPKDKNAKIVLYCRSGRMSGIAAQTLIKLGYTNVSHLAGGMIAWEKSGYVIIKR